MNNLESGMKELQLGSRKQINRNMRQIAEQILYCDICGNLEHVGGCENVCIHCKESNSKRAYMDFTQSSKNGSLYNIIKIHVKRCMMKKKCKCAFKPIPCENLGSRNQPDEIKIENCIVCDEPSHIGECEKKCGECNRSFQKIISFGKKHGERKTYAYGNITQNQIIHSLVYEFVFSCNCQNHNNVSNITEYEFLGDIKKIGKNNVKTKKIIPPVNPLILKKLGKKGVNCINYKGLDIGALTKKCYLCGELRINNMNGSFCKNCKKINEIIKSYERDLTGKVCVVTGGRKKNGYATVIKLLNMGATVYVTTRFKKSAEAKYKRELNYKTWQHRLIILQCDFVDTSAMIKCFTYVVNELKNNNQKIDLLVNNACITIPKFTQFYDHLNENESKNVGDEKHIFSKSYFTHQTTDKTYVPKKGDLSVEKMYPKGMFNRHGEQMSNRKKNTWNINEFDPNTFKTDPETLGDYCKTMDNMHAVNVKAPLLIIKLLMELLIRKKGEDSSHIVNVTSREGNINSNKTKCHVESNILKNNFDMFTRTHGKSFFKLGICMNSVDTGWNDIEQPGAYHYDAPLDTHDAANRVLHPFLTESIQHGVLLVNFREYLW